MATEADLQERFFKPIENKIAAAREAVAREGSIPTLGREAHLDIRSTLHQFFFGCPEPDPNLDAPLHASESHSPEQQDTQSQGKGGWGERVIKERELKGDSGNGEDGYERGRGRSLPDEQKEQAREQERGGRGR